MNNTRRNKPGKLTTAADVVCALKLQSKSADATAAATVFINYMIEGSGADLSPSHLAGMTKQTARHFVDLAAAHPEKAKSLPFVNEAAALVSILPL